MPLPCPDVLEVECSGMVDKDHLQRCEAFTCRDRHGSPDVPSTGHDQMSRVLVRSWSIIHLWLPQRIRRSRHVLSSAHIVSAFLSSHLESSWHHVLDHTVSPCT